MFHSRNSRSKPQVMQGRQRHFTERPAVETASSSSVVHQMDVLFCCDPEIRNKHIGNIQFYHLVEYNKSIYQSLPKRKRLFVAHSIVQTIARSGGRFLQQQRFQVRNTRATHWTEMHYAQSVLKTVEALKEEGSFMNGSAPVAQFLSYDQSRSNRISSMLGVHVNSSITENEIIVRSKIIRALGIWRKVSLGGQLMRLD